MGEKKPNLAAAAKGEAQSLVLPARRISAKDTHPFDSGECPYRAMREEAREGKSFTGDPRTGGECVRHLSTCQPNITNFSEVTRLGPTLTYIGPFDSEDSR